MNPHEKPVLSVIGLGKLGLPMAACFAQKGFHVIGLDADPSKCESLQARKNYLTEPGLDEMLSANWDRISVTSDWSEAVGQSRMTFIVVPTPTEQGGRFTVRYAMEACERIGKILKEKEDRHVVVLTSTVLPGDMENSIRPALEEAGGKKAGRDFGLCYNPEFIALGTVIRDFLNPDLVLIGESDPQSGADLESLYQTICENEPVVRRMNFVNAEITKISINTYITMKISFANMLARISEATEGADADVVSGAVGVDSRIGPKCLKGALGYGGPCFPRDNLALARVAQDAGVEPLLPTATDRFNRLQVRMIADLIRQHLSEGGRAGILGLSYKPGSDVIEEADGLQIALALAAEGIGVIAYDPAAMEQASRVLGKSGIVLASSAKQCLQDTDVVLVATPWKEFEELDAEDLENRRPDLLIIDAWGILSPERFPGIRIYRLGQHWK